MRKVYAERETFSWAAEQDKAFNSIKDTILTNAVAGPDTNLQFHLVVDASLSAI